MTLAETVAFVHAQTACALAEIEAMKAANRARERHGYSDAYGEEAFMNIPDRFGISHNAVLGLFQEAWRG